MTRIVDRTREIGLYGNLGLNAPVSFASLQRSWRRDLARVGSTTSPKVHSIWPGSLPGCIAVDLTLLVLEKTVEDLGEAVRGSAERASLTFSSPSRRRCWRG